MDAAFQFTERRNVERPTAGEAPFEIGEVFFSRTDRRGVIESGNHIFERVSGYGLDELIGAPHKIVRHPDMPRGVFWLLWDRIQSGQPIGAYVNNRARDGLHYWVFALVAPAGAGFVSARIKPSSGLLEKVVPIYADILTAEREQGLAPPESAARLVGALCSLGFDGYHDFMTHALGKELAAERKAIGLPADTRGGHARAMLGLAHELRAQTETLVAEFDTLGIVPHNMLLAAARLEPTGGPFSTLSRNYGAMSKEMSDWFADHVLGEDSNFASIAEKVKEALFLERASEIVRRCDRQLHAERRQLGQMDIEGERRILAQASDTFQDQSRSAFRAVAQEAVRISQACDTMRRHMLGLSTSRVACKIENSRLADRNGSLDDVIAQLAESQARIDGLLNGIEGRSATIAGSAWGMIDKDKPIAEELLFGPAMAASLKRPA